MRRGKDYARLLRRLGIPALSVMVLLMIVAPSAVAVHDEDVFELDANAVTQNVNTGTPDDWDRVYDGTANTSNKRFINDGALNASIFTGGGSKDIQDVSSWKHKDQSGGLPDKDNLLDAFAARYMKDGSSPKDLLYFGADRYDNSGDAQIGFWFFRSKVEAKSNGTFGGTHAVGQVPHNPSHAGDILVLSDFTNGGVKPTISIFEWVGSGGSHGPLNLLGGGTSSPADCPSIGSNDPFCAVTNPADGVTAPWPFKNKSGQSSFGQGELYEGGINLTTLGLDQECFSSFLAETRSSQSTTATLKDFVLGQFQICDAVMSTTPSPGAGGSVVPGTQVTDTAYVQGEGPSNPPFPTGSVTFYICGPIATGVCSSGGTQVGSATALSPTATAGRSSATSDAFDTTGKTPGRYCFRAEWPGDDNYPGALSHTGEGDAECFVIQKLPTTTVTTPVDGSGTPTSSIQLGNSIYDKAVVTGSSAGGDPTGTVSFFVCKLASGTCGTGGTAVTGNPKTLVADSDPATYTASTTSGAFTPTSIGRYCFRGEYSGNGVYLASSDSATTECFTVTDTTSVSTEQDWLPNDSGTVTSTGGSAVSGTLTFTLYKTSDCSGTASDVLYTQSFTLSGAASPATRTTTNTTVKVKASATVSWKVVFASSDGNVAGSQHCEVSSLTITN